MAVHEQKWGFEQVGIGQADLSFLLDFERGGARDQFHQVLANPAAIISVIGAVSYAAHEKGGLFVVGWLAGGGEG